MMEINDNETHKEKLGALTRGREIATKTETWRCIDDGSGLSVTYVSDEGRRTNKAPPGFTHEFLTNGLRRYYHRRKCTRCRKKCTMSLLTRMCGKNVFSFNICDDCLIATTPDISKIRGSGDQIYDSNLQLSTPFNLYLDVAVHADRNLLITSRAKEARIAVIQGRKARRDLEREFVFRGKAEELEIDLKTGKYISWGWFEFDEYFGPLDDHNRPHGYGVKQYSDGSTYVGNFLKGMQHTEEIGVWTRPDGTSYEGTWVQGVKHGKGIQNKPHGAKYIGQFANGYEHGHGKVVEENGNTFEGRFRFGAQDGPGILTLSDGTVKKGNFQSGGDIFVDKLPPDTFEYDLDEDKLLQAPSLMECAIQSLADVMIKSRNKISSKRIASSAPAEVKHMIATSFIEKSHHLFIPKSSDRFVSAASNVAFKQETVEGKFSSFHMNRAMVDASIFFLEGISNLQTLSFTAVNLDLASVGLITRKLFNWSHLKTLNLSFNPFTPDAIEDIVAVVKKSPSLSKLCLSTCRLKPNSGGILGSLLAESSILQELDLSFNMLEARGCLPIAEGLKKNRTLTALNLRQNGLGLKGGEVMVACMKGNWSMRMMNLADNRIGDDLMGSLSSTLSGTLKDVIKSTASRETVMPAQYRLGRYPTSED
jgi:hypothetical protein